MKVFLDANILFSGSVSGSRIAKIILDIERRSNNLAKIFL